MSQRFEVRKQQMMQQCQVEADQLQGMFGCLERFAEPFVSCLYRREQKEHAQTYLQGLMSNLQRKNVESIAYHHDQERLQRFIGCSSWDYQPLLDELVRQVGCELGETDGVIVFDPSGFGKKGSESVGVQRQWLGRMGKVDNGQVGVYMAYASRQEHALVDVRLYLPQSWARDKPRRNQCGVPKQLRYHTRHYLALQMLDEHGQLLPHKWITGDDEMGRSSLFRRELQGRNEHYVLAVPSNTTVRDLEDAPPKWFGRGCKPQRQFEQVRAWLSRLPDEDWTPLHVRNGEKGPLQLQIVKRRVLAKTERRCVGPEELLIVTRTTDEQGNVQHDYYLSNALPTTLLTELARVINAEHRIEECLKRAKSEAGLADYEVRTYAGWYHHQTLLLIATWFLTKEARRGEKIHAGDYRSASAPHARDSAA